MDFYSKGTIKIKNADGVLVPFLPTTDFSCVSNQSNKPLPQIISNMEAEIVEAEMDPQDVKDLVDTKTKSLAGVLSDLGLAQKYNDVHYTSGETTVVEIPD